MNTRFTGTEALSDYLEGNLPPPAKEQFEQQLATDLALARELREMEQMLHVLHALPAREPVLDIWSELSPKIAAIQAEEKLGLVARWQLRVGRFLSNFATGAILFTQALAMNTENRMRKYVVHDPFAYGEES